MNFNQSTGTVAAAAVSEGHKTNQFASVALVDILKHAALEAIYKSRPFNPRRLSHNSM